MEPETLMLMSQAGNEFSQVLQKYEDKLSRDEFIHLLCVLQASLGQTLVHASNLRFNDMKGNK